MNTYWILFIAITVASWLVSALMEQRFKKFSKVYLHLTGKEVAEKINKAKIENRRVIAVGTTTVRTLESASDKKGHIEPCEKETNIFIYPPYEFKSIDGLITNFHLPKSTLIMLVSAFADRDFVLKAYNEAVKEKYRFFSFGDSMFIYGK